MVRPQKTYIASQDNSWFRASSHAFQRNADTERSGYPRENQTCKSIMPFQRTMRISEHSLGCSCSFQPFTARAPSRKLLGSRKSCRAINDTNLCHEKRHEENRGELQDIREVEASRRTVIGGELALLAACLLSNTPAADAIG